MATYGQRPDDVVVDSRGNALSGVLVKVYSTEAAARAGGAPDATATTDEAGRWTAVSTAAAPWVRMPDGQVWPLSGSGGGVTDHGALTGLADDDHTQYALADGTRGTFEASGAVAAHTAAADPHPQYLTAAEGDAAYAAAGTAMPAGGTAGQYLSKTSATDYDAGWTDPPGSVAPTSAQGAWRTGATDGLGGTAASDRFKVDFRNGLAILHIDFKIGTAGEIIGDLSAGTPAPLYFTETQVGTDGYVWIFAGERAVHAAGGTTTRYDINIPYFY